MKMFGHFNQNKFMKGFLLISRCFRCGQVSVPLPTPMLLFLLISLHVFEIQAAGVSSTTSPEPGFYPKGGEHFGMPPEFRLESAAHRPIGETMHTNQPRRFAVEGTVRSETGEAMPGVNVIEKGTINGTVTDIRGHYALSVGNSEATLVFSFIGYLTKEVQLTGQRSIDVTLATNVHILDETVVVGYGTQRRGRIAGSVAPISAKDISSSPSGNLSNNVVGRAPGLIAVQRSGEPGNDQSDIFIRGIGTTGDASPLYVIDGIVSSQSDFAQLNAAEVESFSILKDAASAAVFGVRGGNGIVLVTTKRGSADKTTLSYNVNYGIQRRVRTPDFVNSYQYAQLYNQAMINEGKSPYYTEDDLQKFRDGSDPDGHPNTDWYDAVLKSSAPMWQHNLSANGGTEKTRYALSLSFLDQDGIYTQSRFKRYNLRSNIDANVTATTRLSLDISGRNENRHAPPIAPQEFFYSLLRNRPVDAVKYTNGLYATPVQGNPLALIQPSEGYTKSTDWVITGRLQLEQEIPFVKGLSLKAIGSLNKNFSSYRSWKSPSIETYVYNPSSGEYIVSGTLDKPSLYQTSDEGRSITMEAHVNFENQFGKHKVSGLFLYTQTEEIWSGLGAGRGQYIIRVDELNLGPVNTSLTNSGYSGSSGRRGYVGRVNYTYDDKYIFEASFREDASEQFAPGKRWGFFPSFSGGWIISEEGFMQSFDAIDFLKLRASWGILGNDRLGNERFLYVGSYVSNGDAVFGNDEVQQAIIEGRLPSPDVTWEKVKKLDIGIDATFKEGLLGITFDYFKDRRSDILGQRNASVPAIAGITLPVENLSKVNNRGIDLSLTHRNTINNSLSYNLTGNVTYAKNKVIFIDEPAGTNPHIAATGRSIGSLFEYKAIGIFRSEEEIANAPDQSPLGNAPEPGDIRYADISGPDGKPDNVVDGNDRTYIGKTDIPEIIYGLSGGISFKGFEFSFLLQGAAGVDQYLVKETKWPFYNRGSVLLSELDVWSPDNPDASLPRVLTEENTNHLYSSFWLTSAAYLKLRNVEIAYNFQPQLLSKTWIKALRVYVNANNVFTISKIKNFDPENNNHRAQAYPQLSIVNFGTTIQF